MYTRVRLMDVLRKKFNYEIHNRVRRNCVTINFAKRLYVPKIFQFCCSCGFVKTIKKYVLTKCDELR